MAQAIFITGGGSGIGQATAKYFATKGWFVGLADVNAKGLAETAAMLPQDMSSRHVMDVRDPEAWRAALADFAAKSGGRLDLLFNNAGVGVGGPLADSGVNDLDRGLDINLKGVFHGAMAGFPYLKATPGSALVNTCSAAGIFAGPGMSIYAASKFGVRAMAESLDREWAEHGVKVRTIMPGFIDTPLLQGVSAGSNQKIRDRVAEAGLEFTPVEQVAQAVWDAAHGKRVHTLVGKTARRLRFLSRWAPWMLRRQGLSTREDAL